jgi:hypothetical protein
MKLGIVAASGTFKGVFAHGVLSQFESDGLYADIYGSCSSSVISCSLAAIKDSASIGVDYWLQAIDYAEKYKSMSKVVKYSIKEYAPAIQQKLYTADTARYIIAVSYVNNETASSETQGEKAKRLGRKLIIASAKKDTRWVDSNLSKVIFDTRANTNEFMLNKNNYPDVAYASTRMLHAWDEPAWINGKPYIDGSYTCSCPAFDLASLECNNVIAIGVEPGRLYTNLFNNKEIENKVYDGCNIRLIRPEINLKEYGVDYLHADKNGLIKSFNHGQDCAKKYLDNIY